MESKTDPLPAISPQNLAKVMKDQVNKQKPEEKKVEDHLDAKDFKALRRSKYHEKQNQFNQSFVIQNTKTGNVVELKALSGMHAARFIGWRPRHVKVLDKRTIDQ